MNTSNIPTTSSIVLLDEENQQQSEHSTSLHDLSIYTVRIFRESTNPHCEEEYLYGQNGTKDILEIFLKNKKDLFLTLNSEGKTPLDLVLEGTSELLKKLFIRYSLLADSKQKKPVSIGEGLSNYWDECEKEINQEQQNKLTTDAQPNTFFKAILPSNNDSKVLGSNKMQRPRP